jgi:hypothetical protein
MASVDSVEGKGGVSSSFVLGSTTITGELDSNPDTIPNPSGLESEGGSVEFEKKEKSVWDQALYYVAQNSKSKILTQYHADESDDEIPGAPQQYTTWERGAHLQGDGDVGGDGDGDGENMWNGSGEEENATEAHAVHRLYVPRNPKWTRERGDYNAEAMTARMCMNALGKMSINRTAVEIQKIKVSM